MSFFKKLGLGDKQKEGSSSMLNRLGTVSRLVSSAPSQPEPFEGVKPSIVQRPKRSEQEIIDELERKEPRFFTAEYDPVRHILQTLPDQLDETEMLDLFNEYETLQLAVGKKLSERVMNNYNQFVQGMQYIHDVKMALTMTSIHCTTGRRQLSVAQDDLAHSIFRVLARHRKKTRLMTVQKMLLDIYTVRKKEQEIQDCLVAGDFQTAVLTYRECVELLVHLTQFDCAKPMLQRFKRTSDLIKERVLSRLVALCKQFQQDAFEAVVQALVTLGEVGNTGDDLRRLFLDAVDSLSQETLLSFIPEKKGGDNRPVSMRFRDQCSALDLPTLVHKAYAAVMNTLSDVMFSVHKMVSVLAGDFQHLVLDEVAAKALGKASEKLDQSRGAVWERCQGRVELMLLSKNFTGANTTVTDFARMVQLTNQLISLGERFSGSPAESLREVLNKKCQDYYRSFHRHNFAVLVQQMEDEQWKPLSLGRHWNMMKIEKIKAALEGQASRAEEFALKETLYTRFLDGGSPFSIDIDEGKTKITTDDSTTTTPAPTSRTPNYSPTFSLLTASPSSANADVEVDMTNEHRERTEQESVVSSSSVTMASLVGSYVLLMREMRPVAVEAIKGLQELFDFYLYAIVTSFAPFANRFFADDAMAGAFPSLVASVRSVKQRLEQGAFAQGIFANLVTSLNNSSGKPANDKKSAAARFSEKLKTSRSKPPSSSSSSSSSASSSSASLSSFFSSSSAAATSLANPGPDAFPRLFKLHFRVELTSPNTLFGLTERLVACESFGFVVFVLERCQTRLAALLPSSEAAFRVPSLVNFCTEVWHEFRSYMYRNVAPSLLPFDPINNKMLYAKWDSRELASKHNAYVDSIIATVKNSDVSLRQLGGLPPHVTKQLWKETLIYLTSQLVDRFARIEKCSTEGRALMTQDLRVLKNELEAITGLRPLPSWEYVNSYVLAYYLPESDYLRWVTDHPEYNLSHYISVAHVGPGTSMNKKQRNEFMKTIESLHVKNQERKEAERKQAEQAARQIKARLKIPEETIRSPTARTPVSMTSSSPSSSPRSVTSADSPVSRTSRTMAPIEESKQDDNGLGETLDSFLSTGPSTAQSDSDDEETPNTNTNANEADSIQIQLDGQDVDATESAAATEEEAN